jgi:hypothetical protein
MAKTKKLTKKKDDVIYIDPVTMEKVCSFNECIEKFTKEGTDIIKSPKGDLYDYVVCYHECTQCGRKERFKGDRSKGYKLKMENMGFTLATYTEPSEGLQ